MYESDKEYLFTEDELVDLCREWQETLRLQHWDVALRVSRATEFTGKERSGECSWVLPNAHATIKILDHIDYPETPFKQDMEQILVHELLHLHICPFDLTKAESLEDTMMERAVDHIAKALVLLKRRAVKPVDNISVINTFNAEQVKEAKNKVTAFGGLVTSKTPAIVGD